MGINVNTTAKSSAGYHDNEQTKPMRFDETIFRVPWPRRTPVREGPASASQHQADDCLVVRTPLCFLKRGSDSFYVAK
ncbi:hypothetical protein NDU88_001014 [Pleurodeles waltl]|uniref:Uncharacterized protein n=1 Tax=Pleurodeles waltl TaxID=8319 RepID=A0AAV7LYH8_PLEWA|nr:hypothetical protein NDU88_001014 [Pleurodeles waltl]